MMERFIGYVVWAFICILLIMTGWDQPLRYKILNPAEIAAYEHTLMPPAQPAAVHEPVAKWHPTGGALDRAPYTRYSEGVTYNRKSSDGLGLGTASEAPVDRRRL